MKKILLALSVVGFTVNTFAAHTEDDIKKALTSDLDKCFISVHKIKIYSISYLNTIYNVGCIKSFVDDLI
jgi:hypothetical protein